MAHAQAAPSKTDGIIASLLKDICSTDVCFVFPGDKVIPNAVVCAHRFALTPHKQLCKLLFQEDRDLSLREKKTLRVDPKRDVQWCVHGSDCKMPRQICASIASGVVADAMARFEVSVVNVGEFSLATFCAFLIYLYTDEIDLEPVTSRFSMFRFSNCCSKIPLWIDQPTVLETTWDELLQVAIHYGIMDLQMRCKDGVFYNINKETAIATLFSISAKDPDVRRLAMDTALKSINVIFKEVEDPFAHYKDHPDYHRVMLELMRLLTNGE